MDLEDVLLSVHKGKEAMIEVNVLIFAQDQIRDGKVLLVCACVLMDIQELVEFVKEDVLNLMKFGIKLWVDVFAKKIFIEIQVLAFVIQIIVEQIKDHRMENVCA